MVKGKSWCDKNIKIVAAGSNDSGVSWIVEVAGKRIFHAGDHSRTSKARDTTIL
jgi:L-ascorbate metabolism protein UlaG (beta-lactamase superfamily)